jgi:hypothetical protein
MGTATTPDWAIVPAFWGLFLLPSPRIWTP